VLSIHSHTNSPKNKRKFTALSHGSFLTYRGKKYTDYVQGTLLKYGYR
jgi:hypothetical protein